MTRPDVDLSQVPSGLLEAELTRRRGVPRLEPPSGRYVGPRPLSVLVDAVPSWRGAAGGPAGTGWDRCVARLLSPVSGVDALELATPDDVDEAVSGLLLARALVADPSSGWTLAHRGLGPARRDAEDRRVLCHLRAGRWGRR